MTGETLIGDVSADGGWAADARVAAVTARSAALNRWIVDDDPSPAFPLYTRANIGEVFPDVVQPLSWTLWGIPHAEIGWRIAFERLGAFDLGEFPADSMAMLGVFNGFGYLNASASRVFGERTPGLGAAAIDASFFGEQPDVPPYAPKPGDASPAHAAKLGAMLAWLFSAPDLTDIDAMRAAVEAERAARPDLSGESDAALFARVERLCGAHFRPLWVRHIMATYHSTIPAGVIAGIAAAVGEGARAADALTSDAAADSAAPALALWELSRAAEPVADAADPRFATFIAAYGFRGPNEWEMRSRTWEIDPAAPLAALRQLRRAADADGPAARAAARARAKAEAVAAIEAKLEGDAATLAQFRAAVAAAGRFFAARERTKTSCAMLVHEMRLPMHELGRRFAARGHLAAPEHFALLTAAEWRAALLDPAGTRALADARAAQESRLAAREPAFIVNGAVPEAAERHAEAAALLETGAVLAGAPGCAGVARGRARIVLDPGDPGELAPDDILVAPHTDPSWTPLMASVAGVVVNVGATVSHAVIVARELGVPCAVSVTGATDRIPPGAMVEVDGGAGTVRLL